MAAADGEVDMPGAAGVVVDHAPTGMVWSNLVRGAAPAMTAVNTSTVACWSVNNLAAAWMRVMADADGAMSPRALAAA